MCVELWGDHGSKDDNNMFQCEKCDLWVHLGACNACLIATSLALTHVYHSRRAACEKLDTKIRYVVLNEETPAAFRCQYHCPSCRGEDPVPYQDRALACARAP